MTYKLNRQEIDFINSLAREVRDLQAQFVGAQKALCASRGLTGNVEFREDSIETIEDSTKCKET